MPQINSEQFNIAIDKVPEKILGIGFAENTSVAMKNITARYNTTTQAFDVSAAVGYALVGLIPIKRLIQALQEDAGLSAETAKNVAHDVRADIFAPVAKELAAMQEDAEKQWEKAHTNEIHNTQHETEKQKIPSPLKKDEEHAPSPLKKGEGQARPDESVVREVFPEPEIDEKKFDNGLEKSKEESDKRF